MDGLPAVPSDLGTHPLEHLTRASKFGLADHLVEIVKDAPSVANPEIADGPDVGPGHRVHQVHLGGPGSDPANGGDLVGYLGVTHAPVSGDVDPPVSYVLCQIDDGLGLGSRKASRFQIVVAGLEDRVDTHGAAAGLRHARVDGGGGRRREELKDDGARQGGKALLDAGIASSGWFPGVEHDTSKRPVAFGNGTGDLVT